MNNVLGFNPINWNCMVAGCFNYHRHFDIEHFAQCFPRSIGFTDLDSFVELNGNFLIVEFKDEHSDLKTGQRIAFERLTSVSTLITIVVARCDYRNSQIFSFKVIRNGKTGNFRQSNLDEFIGFVKAWADRVDSGRVAA